jgi:hypothetical protein
MKILTRPKRFGITDLEAAAAHVERHRLSCVGLQLDRVSPRSGGGVHNGQGALKTLIVITAHFGNHERRMFSTDQPTSDFNGHQEISSEDDKKWKGWCANPKSIRIRIASASAGKILFFLKGQG